MVVPYTGGKVNTGRDIGKRERERETIFDEQRKSK